MHTPRTGGPAIPHLVHTPLGVYLAFYHVCGFMKHLISTNILHQVLFTTCQYFLETKYISVNVTNALLQHTVAFCPPVTDAT